jgi:hypothetical protein
VGAHSAVWPILRIAGFFCRAMRSSAPSAVPVRAATFHSRIPKQPGYLMQKPAVTLPCLLLIICESPFVGWQRSRLGGWASSRETTSLPGSPANQGGHPGSDSLDTQSAGWYDGHALLDMRPRRDRLYVREVHRGGCRRQRLPRGSGRNRKARDRVLLRPPAVGRSSRSKTELEGRPFFVRGDRRSEPSEEGRIQ